MGPLIEITNVPIEIEMKVSHAKLEYTRGTAELEISRDNGGSIQQSAEKGRQAAYQATATYAQQGELLLKTQIGEELVTQFAADAAAKDVKTNIGIQFLPSVGPELDWDPGEVNIRFEMDKLNFDWRVNQTQFKFTPGDIEISVKQQPDVIIKYIGGPLYVPPSADPNYEPVDVQA